MRDKTPNLTDYEQTYREFRWEIPEHGGYLQNRRMRTFKIYGDKPF